MSETFIEMDGDWCIKRRSLFMLKNGETVKVKDIFELFSVECDNDEGMFFETEWAAVRYRDMLLDRFEWKGVVFDDVTDGDDGKWSQLCEEHYYDMVSRGETNMTESASDTAICGVKGCEKNADYYIDFVTEEDNG